MLNIAHGLLAEGIPVEMILLRKRGAFAALLPREATVVELGARNLLAAIPPLARYLRRERPAAFLAALALANLASVAAHRLAGSPTRLVLSVHTTYSQSYPRKKHRLLRTVVPRLMRWLYPLADAVVAVSQGAARDLVSYLGLSPAHVQTIYNPVIGPDFYARAAQPVDHPWFAPGQPPVIASVGRLVKAKDYATLLRAFALVQPQHDSRLLILGEGRERAALEAQVRELGLEAVVQLPGYAENPYAALARARLLVLSSAWEGFGNVLVEALALGTPVIATDCPSGPREILRDGAYGVLCPVGDPDRLAQAMLAELRQPEKTAPDFPAATYTAETVARQYRAVLFPAETAVPEAAR